MTSVSRGPRATRGAIAAATVLLIAGIVAVTLIVADGAGNAAGGGGGPLAWEGTPRVAHHPTLPDDRILTGRIRNESLRPVQVSATDLRLHADDGTAIDGVGIFLEAFLHPLLPPGRDAQVPPSELARQGRLLELPPGETAPVTVAWRQERGAAAPSDLSYGRGRLPVPGPTR